MIVHGGSYVRFDDEPPPPKAKQALRPSPRQCLQYGCGLLASVLATSAAWLHGCLVTHKLGLPDRRWLAESNSCTDSDGPAGWILITPGCLPSDSTTDLWCPGDAGYMCYKIPTLVKVPRSSTLLAIIEARRYSCDDHGWVDMLLRRSDDDGASWAPATLIWSNSTDDEWHTVGDANPVLDRNGRLHLLLTRDNADVLYTTSDDLGRSWRLPPRNVSSLVLTQRSNIGTGHAGGIRLAGSDRLVVPLYGGGRRSYALLSDDDGATWRPGGDLGVDAAEWAVAEVKAGSGRLIGSLRGVRGRRLQAYSDDGGETWGAAYEVAELPEPVTGCEGALVLHPNGRLYYAHPDPPPSTAWLSRPWLPSPMLRERMNIKVSDDGGRTWQQHVQLWGADAGNCVPPCVPAASYSSLAVLGDGAQSELALLYMRNNASMLIFEGRGVAFATFAP